MHHRLERLRAALAANSLPALLVVTPTDAFVLTDGP